MRLGKGLDCAGAWYTDAMCREAGLRWATAIPGSRLLFGPFGGKGAGSVPKAAKVRATARFQRGRSCRTRSRREGSAVRLRGTVVDYCKQVNLGVQNYFVSRHSFRTNNTVR